MMIFIIVFICLITVFAVIGNSAESIIPNKISPSIYTTPFQAFCRFYDDRRNWSVTIGNGHRVDDWDVTECPDTGEDMMVFNWIDENGIHVKTEVTAEFLNRGGFMKKNLAWDFVCSLEMNGTLKISFIPN